MLTIICGEDSVGSRNYFFLLKKDSAKKNYEIKDIQTQEIAELRKWLLQSPSLFLTTRIYFTENLIKSLKKNKDMILELEELANNPDFEIINWENGLSSRELKTIKGSKIKEFKLSENVFKLLDACYPPCKLQFLRFLNLIIKNKDENFIFLMLARHIRNLLIVKSGQKLPKLQTWQIKKLQMQSSYWPLDKLISFYEALYRIEKRMKTSTSPYSIKNSLEVLACFYL